MHLLFDNNVVHIILLIFKSLPRKSNIKKSNLHKNSFKTKNMISVRNKNVDIFFSYFRNFIMFLNNILNFTLKMHKLYKLHMLQKL